MRAPGTLVILALAAAAGSAQQPTPVFRSGADLVRFDVRVTDASGRPIRDLRPDEIEIVEDGTPRPILLFQHLEEPAGLYAEAALRAVSAEVSSNRGAPRGHLYLLVFDQRHITPGNELAARRAAEAFIKTRVRQSDRVGVAGIPGPGPQLGFTADRTRAIAELQKVQGSLERNLTTATGRMSVHEAYEAAAGSDQVIADLLKRQAQDLSADGGAGISTQTTGRDRPTQRTEEDPAIMRKVIVENARTIVSQVDTGSRDSLMRLADLVEQYRSIEGRKTVLFFSEGFHQQNVSRELERVAASAAASYAVFNAFDLNRRANVAAQALPSATTEASEIQARMEPLGSLAVETDGTLVVDAATHLDAALTKIADQAQDYYLVGFTPSAAALSSAGAYRRVTVRVRRPGARVSARTGYAVPRAGPLDRRAAIDAALAAPFSQQALRVQYTTYTMRSDNAGRARVILSLEADLPLRNGTNGAADVVFVVRHMRDGRVAASGTDTMPLPAAAEGGATTGLGTYRVHFDVAPGSYIMRAVVREPGGLIGSADRKLDIRGITGPDVTVSDVILGSPAGGLPVRARAYTKDGLTGMLEAYARSRDQLQTLTVVAVLTPASGGPAVATLRADAGEIMSTGLGVLRRATFALPIESLEPGPYVVRIKVTGAADEAVADLTREVDVFSGSAPPLPPPAAPELRPREVLESDFVRVARASMRAASTPAALKATKGFDGFERGDYAAAASELAEALTLSPTNAPIAFVLGWAYEGAGDHRHAIGSWRAAATIDPKLVSAHLALADAYLRLSEPALAAQAVRAGLASLPDSPELQAKLALIQGRQR